jgi:hypothetical protein
MRQGTVLVDLTTAPVDLTRELAARCAGRAIAYADAPVARTRHAAEKGELSVMVGAAAATFGRIEPLLRCFASDLLHCGGIGTGQIAKLMNNMVLFETGGALAEALAIGRQSGIAPEVLLEALSRGSADSFALRNHGRTAMLPGAYPERAFSTVVAEPFGQWVIEDGFCGPRPAWEQVGAELVASAAPYEEMKLRLLNGSHSALAYLGFLAGFEHIADVVAEADFRAFMRRMMAEEVAPTLVVPTDLAAYQASLLERFANPAIRHKTAQIAMDGSQKLPQRLLGTIRDQLATGGPVRHLTLAVAAWMRYAAGRDEAGRTIPVADPLSERLAAIGSGAGGDAAALAAGFLGVREVFGEDLPAEPRFTGAVADWLRRLMERGARATVAACVAG